MNEHDPDDDEPTGEKSNGTKPKSKDSKGYAVGYGKPPKDKQFQSGESGNPHGRPKGQPTIEQILLEEAARLVKIQAGGETIKISKERALIRKLFQLGMQGNVAAARLILTLRNSAQRAEEVAPPPEEPLTADELDTLKLLMKRSEANNVARPQRTQ